MQIRHKHRQWSGAPVCGWYVAHACERTLTCGLKAYKDTEWQDASHCHLSFLLPSSHLFSIHLPCLSLYFCLPSSSLVTLFPPGAMGWGEALRQRRGSAVGRTWLNATKAWPKHVRGCCSARWKSHLERKYETYEAAFTQIESRHEMRVLSLRLDK